MKRLLMVTSVLACVTALFCVAISAASGKGGGGGGAVITVTVHNTTPGYALGRVLNNTSGTASHLLYLYPSSQASTTNAHKTPKSSDVIDLTFWPENAAFSDPGFPIHTQVTVPSGNTQVDVTLVPGALDPLVFGDILVR